MRVVDYLLKAVRDAAAVFYSEVQVAPACILWPDKDRQWEAVIPRLQTDLPELLILGDYKPDKRTGPAIWLRCVLAGKVEAASSRLIISGKMPLPLCQGRMPLPPIFYLPGISRQDLRAIETCPDYLKPLAELQYRGVIWSQLNAKDWTILAFLKSDQGGLGLDTAQDNEAKSAMNLALYRLLDEDIELLKDKRLDKDYFNTLLTGGDLVRDLLQWLDQGDAFKNSRGPNEWKAFVAVCKSQVGFNPHTEGILAGATKLASRSGPWKAVWERYQEAPKRYPNIPNRIRSCSPPSNTIFWCMSDGSCDGWPQWNEEQEKNLHRELVLLENVQAPTARKKLLELERHHGRRSQLIWAELGEAPLAQALRHLAVLADITQSGLVAGTVEDLAMGYRTKGWQADHSLLQALSVIDSQPDYAAVTSAIRAVYLPWAEEAARYLQKIIDGASYPGGTIASTKKVQYQDGECVLFVDGLRFDTAKCLAGMLEKENLTVMESPAWSPLPSVTGTGKPAVAPIFYGNQVAEESACYNFEPMTSYLLRKTLEDKGWKILERSNNGDGQGNAWCEFGDIDHEGHDRGWKLARTITALLIEIRDRIAALLSAGWKSVRVVTDHGWLLLPGGLPKSELPACLTDSKWGRCALLKQGASTEEQLFPWYWNPNQYFALANGISCFKKGQEYAHGGLSLQECLVLELTVSRGKGVGSNLEVEFTDITWKGLRCTVAVDGQFAGLSIDLRTQPGDETSTVLVSVKPLKANGTASVVVENEDLEGQKATLVLLDPEGSLVAEIPTVIGGGNA